MRIREGRRGTTSSTKKWTTIIVALMLAVILTPNALGNGGEGHVCPATDDDGGERVYASPIGYSFRIDGTIHDIGPYTGYPYAVAVTCDYHWGGQRELRTETCVGDAADSTWISSNDLSAGTWSVTGTWHGVPFFSQTLGGDAAGSYGCIWWCAALAGEVDICSEGWYVLRP